MSEYIFCINALLVALSSFNFPYVLHVTNTVQVQCENVISVFTLHYYTSCHFIEKAHLREDCFTNTFEIYFIYILNNLWTTEKLQLQTTKCQPLQDTVIQ